MFPLKDTQPSYSKPLVTLGLIAANILIFLYEFSLDPYSLNHFIGNYGLVPDRFHAYQIMTSMFIHGGWLHVLGNMWFLWIFGDNVEDALGHGKYLIFYILCGTAAAFVQLAASMGSSVPTVGASGAIAGVMGAYIVKFPQSRILTLVFIFFFITTFEVPAVIMLAYWFLIQLFSGVGSIGYSNLSQGGVAWFAHVGGFLAGMALIKIMGTRRRYSRRRDIYW
ncbi:MAG: rhomboid family intramembrane serine protease [Acidobacteria bacterium]|nr:rhomboid family intramembrane serine protease [Acidobacteriota bacterium]